MLRRIFLGGITILMFFGMPSLGHGQVSVNIGINLPAPPPLVPVPLLRFHAVSDDHGPPADDVLKVVPPTCVMLVLSEGNGTPLVNASPSPEALKNDCPCADICLKIFSEALSRPPGKFAPHEQPICRAKFTVSFAMVLNIVDHAVPPFGPSYTTTFATPGAIERTISMSSATSMLLAVGVATPPLTGTFVNVAEELMPAVER